MAGAQHYPYPAPIEAYGNGGFRFAGMSHRGSLLCLPSGIYAWEVAEAAAVGPHQLAPVLAEAGGIRVLLLGLGRRPVSLPEEALMALVGAGLPPEAMDTGAACRTYNVLLAEGRPVAAALIAVD